MACNQWRQKSNRKLGQSIATVIAAREKVLPRITFHDDETEKAENALLTTVATYAYASYDHDACELGRPQPVG